MVHLLGALAWCELGALAEPEELAVPEPLAAPRSPPENKDLPRRTTVKMTVMLAAGFI